MTFNGWTLHRRVLPVALRRMAGERLQVLATFRDAAGVRAPFDLAALFGAGRGDELDPR